MFERFFENDDIGDGKLFFLFGRFEFSLLGREFLIQALDEIWIVIDDPQQFLACLDRFVFPDPAFLDPTIDCCLDDLGTLHRILGNHAADAGDALLPGDKH